MTSKQFKPTLWSSVTAAILFVLLINLGFWQIHRYHYKQHILNQYHAGLEGPPMNFKAIEEGAGPYQHVIAHGAYLNNKTVLLDSRWHNHQLGYDVLTPLKLLGEDKAILVNRGWVPAPAYRDQLPNVPNAAAVTQVTGYVNLINPRTFILGKNIAQTDHWPLRIQKVDTKALEKLIGVPLYPFVLRLDSSERNGFIRAWSVINVMPERHLGYAVQWFAMAFALLIAFFAFSWRRPEK